MRVGEQHLNVGKQPDGRREMKLVQGCKRGVLKDGSSPRDKNIEREQDGNMKGPVGQVKLP